MASQKLLRSGDVVLFANFILLHSFAIISSRLFARLSLDLFTHLAPSPPQCIVFSVLFAYEAEINPLLEYSYDRFVGHGFTGFATQFIPLLPGCRRLLLRANTVDGGRVLLLHFVLAQFVNLEFVVILFFKCC